MSLPRPARRFAGVLALAAGAACAPSRSADLGLWFDPISYESRRVGRLTADDFRTIDAVARSEVTDAFRGLRVHLSDRRDAHYRLRVIQEAQDLRMKRPWGVAGSSRAVPGLGGSGVVSFVFLASAAESYVPGDAGRTAILDAIGRGIGRTAVHEFTHQLLPRVSIHASRDERGYEFASAIRPAQFSGEMHWDLAWPLLRQEFGE